MRRSNGVVTFRFLATNGMDIFLDSNVVASLSTPPPTHTRRGHYHQIIVCIWNSRKNISSLWMQISGFVGGAT